MLPASSPPNPEPKTRVLSVYAKFLDLISLAVTFAFGLKASASAFMSVRPAALFVRFVCWLAEMPARFSSTRQKVCRPLSPSPNWLRAQMRSPVSSHMRLRLTRIGSLTPFEKSVRSVCPLRSCRAAV